MWIGDFYFSAGWIAFVVAICAAHIIAAKFGVRLGDGSDVDRYDGPGVNSEGEVTGAGPRLVPGVGYRP